MEEIKGILVSGERVHIRRSVCKSQLLSHIPGMNHWNLKFSKRHHLKVLLFRVMWFIRVISTLAWWWAVSTWPCPFVGNPGVTETFPWWPRSHRQFWVRAALLVILTTPGFLWGTIYQAFFSKPLSLRRPHFPCRLPFLIRKPSHPSCFQQVPELWSDTSNGTSNSSKSCRLGSRFPVPVWLLFSPLFFASCSLHALRLGTGQSFQSVLIVFKSFSPKQIFAYGNHTFAIWFFLLPHQRNSQFHIYFGKLSFPQMVSPKHQSKVRVYAFLQRFWAEVRITHVFLLPSAVISSVHLIMGHNLTFFFFLS